MTIDLSVLGMAIILGLAGFVVWIIRRIILDLKSLEKSHGDFKTHVAERYVEKDDLHRHLNDIKDMLKRLFEKVDKR